MKITRGRIPGAKKVVVYGPEGIGKSTFASRFPEPLFIDTEGSTKELDVARTPTPTSWTMLKEQIRYVIDHPDICKTLVVDTIDWAEQMCVEDICASHQKKGIEDFGYGNGYVYVREEFGRFLNLLGEVREKCRASFTLRLVLPYGGSRVRENAALLLELQRWVLEESAGGRAPVFGNADTQQERLTAADAKLEKTGDEGTAVYAVQLKAEYTIQY